MTIPPSAGRHGPVDDPARVLISSRVCSLPHCSGFLAPPAAAHQGKTRSARCISTAHPAGPAVVDWKGVVRATEHEHVTRSVAVACVGNVSSWQASHSHGPAVRKGRGDGGSAQHSTGAAAVSRQYRFRPLRGTYTRTYVMVWGDAVDERQRHGHQAPSPKRAESGSDPLPEASWPVRIKVGSSVDDEGR